MNNKCKIGDLKMQYVGFRLDDEIKEIIKGQIQNKIWKIKGVHNFSDFVRYLIIEELKNWDIK